MTEMKRRSFIQWILGVMGLGAVSFQQTNGQKPIIANGIDSNQEWEESREYYDFINNKFIDPAILQFPEKVVSFLNSRKLSYVKKKDKMPKLIWEGVSDGKEVDDR